MALSYIGTTIWSKTPDIFKQTKNNMFKHNLKEHYLKELKNYYSCLLFILKTETYHIHPL